MRVERLTLRGEGLAQGVVIERVLPGEIVEGDAIDGRIAQPRILAPSVQRVAAACRHYRACGGCALMHASDEFVAGWKQDVVRLALDGQGLEAPFRPILTSPSASRRRATLAGRRLKSGPLVGFHGRASGTVTEIGGCRLLDPALIAVLPAMEALVEAGAARKGEVRLTATRFDEGVDLTVEGGKALDSELRARLPELALRHGILRLSWNGEVLLQQNPPTLTLGRAQVSPPPGAFLQATPQGEAALILAVREALGPARKVADLFAGCGTFALPLAETAEVHAVEGNGALMTALDVAWRRAGGLKRVTTETRDLFRRPLLPEELAKFDAVVIDPPRAGAEAQIAELARARIPRIAHVSCNPLTFARDARTLVAAGYRLDWVQVIDQFRWSSHIELAASFVRA